MKAPLNEKLIRQAYLDLYEALPVAPDRLEPADVLACRRDGDVAHVAHALPLAWCMALDDGQLVYGVNQARVGLVLAKQCTAEVINQLGPYARLVTTLLTQDVSHWVTSVGPALLEDIRKQPAARLREVSGEDRARTHQAFHATGLSPAVIAHALLNRTMH